jgi:hypothetical protein
MGIHPFNGKQSVWPLWMTHGANRSALSLALSALKVLSVAVMVLLSWAILALSAATAIELWAA